MSKRFVFFIVLAVLLSPSVCICSYSETIQGEISEGNTSLIYRNVTMYAPAVASTDKGYVGVISTITVTIQSNGSGRVFVDTLPLTQVDMQGSARLAVKVAIALVQNDKGCKVDPYSYDYFFVVRTSSPIIGGPSAGAVMTVATVALLENWSIDDKTIMTGMINPDGSIGPIGGIIQKVDAANSVGANRFLIPQGQGTYTEMVTTTESSNGWVRTVTKPVTRDVSEYAMSNYGIDVIEVAEINEAVENFTGYTFDFEESEKEITTEDYIESMEPLASSLIGEATLSLDNATDKFENSSIPNYFPSNYRTTIQNQLENSEDDLEQAEEWYDKKLYYTSTSKSFQSLIESRFVSYACTYYKSGDENYIEGLLNDTENLYNSSSKLAKNAKIEDYITLQSVGAAQSRASEAKVYLDRAKSKYIDGNLGSFSDVLEFLYDIAFVVERCNSIGWWIDIGDHFNKTGEITNSTLENLALEYINEAQQSIFYSQLILNEMGSASSQSANYLNSASNLLDSAQDDLDEGYPAAALFESLESLVKANLALEIIGTNAENKIDFAKEKASNNIAKIRKMGIEPILAVSYYEFAESLANETTYDSALIYYKYSGMIAGAISFTNITCGTSSYSRYVGIPESTSSNLLNWAQSRKFLLVTIFILGGLVGLGIGLIIVGLVKEDEYRKKDKTRSFKHDKQKKTKYEYPGDKIPRSINDYYKKNK